LTSVEDCKIWFEKFGLNTPATTREEIRRRDRERRAANSEAINRRRRALYAGTNRRTIANNERIMPK
jgi:hypothetical protein